MLLLSVDTWTWNNGTSSGLERGLTYGSELYNSRTSRGHYKEQCQPILFYVMHLVVIHSNGWLAFFLVFQLICDGKEYWQLKQDWFQHCLAFDSSLPEVLKLLISSFELLRSNHGEAVSLCGMFTTTTIQFPTCVLILQQKKIFKWVCPFSHILVNHRKHPAQRDFKLSCTWSRVYDRKFLAGTVFFSHTKPASSNNPRSSHEPASHPNKLLVCGL